MTGFRLFLLKSGRVIQALVTRCPGHCATPILSEAGIPSPLQAGFVLQPDVKMFLGLGF